jgi:hypothetical protein
MRHTLLRAALANVVLSAALVACARKNDPPASAPGAAPAVPGAARPGLPAPAEGAAPAQTDARKQGAAAAGPGEWVDADLYRLKLERLRDCRGSNATRVGALLRIEAKVDELPVSPRDAVLASDGTIIHGERPNAPRVPGCSPELPVRQLKRDEVVLGTVVFDLDAGFEPTPGSLALVYRPAGSSGAGRVTVRLPDCLARCEEPGHALKRPSR